MNRQSPDLLLPGISITTMCGNQEDPRFKQLIHDHIEREGIYSLKRARVQEDLAANLQGKPPSLQAIAHIL